MVEQGDVIKIDGVRNLALVISKNYYNESGKAILCPVCEKDLGTTFSMEIELNDTKFYVCCDAVKQMDVDTRGYTKKGHLQLGKLIQVINLAKSIIDYI